jgi:hypothetical protein
MLDAADEAHREAVYAENNEGGKSRGCVSAVARALGVDITTGPGSMWSNDRMRKVIDAARALKDDRDHWEQEAANWQAARDTWKALAEQHAAELAPAQWQLRSVIQERDVALERLANARELLAMRPEEPDDVDVLRATVVRQANEITELKGESA